MLALGWLLGNLLAHLLSPLSWLWALPLLPLALLARFLLGLLLGLLWTLLWIELHFHPVPKPEVTTLTGEIVAPVEARRYGWRVVMETERGRLSLSWPRRYPRPEAGEVWRLRVKLSPPRGPFNPGGFDRELDAWRKGLAGKGRVVGRPERLGRRTNLAAIREALAERIEERLEGWEAAGLVKALLLGIRSDISREQKRILRETGTAHLLAISGLHIGMVAAAVGKLLWRWPKVALPGALLAACGYAALAGFSLPTQRALVMVAVGLLALWQRRRLSPWDGFGLALIAVLLLDPRAPLGLSFWLSFGAVFWILYAVAGRSARPSGFRMVLKLQAFLLLGQLPILVATFGYLAPLALPANLIAIPAVTLLVLPLLFLGLLLPPLLPPAAWLLERLLDLLALLAWPLELPFPTPPLWAVASATLGTAILLMPRGLPSRWLGALFLLPLFSAGGWPELREGEARLTLLDVGHGLAAVVETREHLLIYDTGPPWRARSVLLPFLRFLGKRPDLIVVSHEDRDHSGGLPVLRERFPSAPVLSGTPEQLGAEPCLRGKGWRWDGVDFEFLWPPDDGKARSDNDRSCVLRVVAAGRSLLLSGDITRRVEGELEGVAAEVLVAPHHGSRSSSSREFVERVAPDHVLFSSGWRPPHPEVVARYQEVGSEIHTTSKHGAIVVELTERGIELRHWREVAGRYWNR